jgi:hypothetical protein
MAMHQRGPRLQLDTLLVAERQQLALNQPRMVLDLIDRRHHARILDNFAQVMDLEALTVIGIINLPILGGENSPLHQHR